MKDFKHFGIKRRIFEDHNYDALWYNTKTIRFGEGQAKELPADQSEFYDVSLGTVCTTGKCPFCFPAGTSVITEDGINNIEDVTTDMRVLSYNNTLKGVEFAQVDQLFSRQYKGQLYKIHFGSARLVCTPNHPIYIINEFETNSGRYVEARNLQKEIEDLKEKDSQPLLMITNAPYACVSDTKSHRERHDYLNESIIGMYKWHWCKIDSIETFDYDGMVYNIGVQHNHTYFADGVQVHNCYVAARPDGKFYEDICETWKKWMGTFFENIVMANGKPDENGNAQLTRLTLTNKPYQVAIGSESEPTEHPDFCDFLKTVYETNVVPNYTTNGVLISEDTELSEKILEATRKYVAGVAVSFGNKNLQEQADKAIRKLIKSGDCVINIHHIISDKASVDDFVEVWKRYGDDIKYHVLLPLMAQGRSEQGLEDGVFEYLEDVIKRNKIKNASFGAHFYEKLKTSKIKTWLYPPESFSKNVLLQKDKVVITPSSFDMHPVKVVAF